MSADLCLPGYKVCDNVCIEEFQICCPADTPELDNAGGCLPDQTCIFNGCCDIGDICLGIGGGVTSKAVDIEVVASGIVASITEDLADITETAVIEEDTDFFDSDDDDEEATETEVVVAEATVAETEVVAEETGSAIGGGIDDIDDDDDEEEVGNPGGNVNTIPTRSGNADNPQSTGAAPLPLGQNGVAKKALLGLGLFALLAL